MEKIRPKIEAIDLPEGYKLEWHGELEDSKTANQALLENLPLALLLMVLIIIALFNNFRQPMLIFLIVPMAFIGIIAGFLVTRLNFGFVAIIGGLGLIGMMIKNAVVLLDQINIDINSGKEKRTAVIDATVSRVRPVTMAALTTILGMFPLLFDDMFQGMAVAIMFGLLFGTIITLVIVPVLYAVFYKVNTRTIGHTDEDK
jgi:multidrug efflux pump subunit AcrB